MPVPPMDTAPLPPLSAPYALLPEHIDEYQQSGHVLLRGVCSPDEIAAYRPRINGAAERFNTETRPLEERDAYGKAFLQITNLWTRDESVRRFTLARRFGHIAAALMGVDGVRLYHDQALFKEPGGGPTPWHQDQFYWPLDTEHTVTMWMPLVPLGPETGSMTFASESHRLGYLGELAISETSESVFRDLIAQRGLQTTWYGPMAAGDATFHAGWTLHGAPGNPTGTMREVMTIIYVADNVRISEPDNPNRVADLETWLPGLQPGEVAASALNPLIYSRASEANETDAR